MSTIRKNQPIYRRTKKPAVDLLAQQLERARAAQRARERIAEKDAEAFWSEQRAAQGYAASQIFEHGVCSLRGGAFQGRVLVPSPKIGVLPVKRLVVMLLAWGVRSRKSRSNFAGLISASRFLITSIAHPAKPKNCFVTIAPTGTSALASEDSCFTPRPRASWTLRRRASHTSSKMPNLFGSPSSSRRSIRTVLAHAGSFPKVSG